MQSQIIVSDALAGLQNIPTDCVDCCVTSVPYWSLRDYETPGAIGLEPTPAQWCRNLVEVFEEVRRVLKKTGTLWLNCGDCYNAGTNGRRQISKSSKHGSWLNTESTLRANAAHLKRKDLVGLPWMLAFALRDVGWYLRCDIIWNKNNGMPETVYDRPSRMHEYIFLLSKSPRYFYCQAALQEPASAKTNARGRMPGRFLTGPGTQGVNPKAKHIDPGNPRGRPKQNPSWSAGLSGKVDKRNGRAVWTFGVQARKEKFYSAFPDELPRRCITAGCPEGGIVLDPFAGRGTTLVIAARLARRFIGIEINPQTAQMAREALGLFYGDLEITSAPRKQPKRGGRKEHNHAQTSPPADRPA